MSIKKKIGLIIGAMVLSTLVLVGVGWRTMGVMQSDLSSIVDDQFVTLIDQDITPLIANDMLPLINEDVARLQELEGSMKLMLEADRDAHQAVIAEKLALAATTEDEMQAAAEANSENVDQAETRMAKAAEAFRNKDAQKLYAEFTAAFGEWKTATQKVLTLAADPTKLMFARRTSNGGTAQETFDTMRDMIDQLQTIQTQEIDALVASIDQRKERVNANEKSIADKRANVMSIAAASTDNAARMTTLFAIIGVVTSLAAVVAGVFVSRSITRSISKIIDELTSGAEQVNDAASQVSDSSRQLAEGASEQASSLEETASALQEMSAMTRRNADNAKEANELSLQASNNARSGDQTMAQLNNAMSGINNASAEISKIIKVIEEIAFQTNLLALNAAVEAARAGEHGKGFAVVADEVRNLAMRAAGAARETTTLIENSVTSAGEGAAVAEDAAKTLQTIVSDVVKVTDLLGGIARASEEQAMGVEQLNTAVSQMDRVTQQNAAGAEESSAAAETLSSQAGVVRSMVDELRAVVGGRKRLGAAHDAN